MSRGAGFLHRPPELSPGDEVRWRRPVGRLEGRRAIGGALYVTRLELLFVPNRLSGGRRPATWRLPLAEVGEVEILERSGRMLLGGLPARLRLAARDGGAETFIVKHLEEVVAELEALLRGVG